MFAEAAPLPPRTVSGVTITRGGRHPAQTLARRTHQRRIRRAQSGPRRGSRVHGELLAQGEVLDRELAVAAAEERERAKSVE